MEANIRVNAHWFGRFVFHRGDLRRLTCLLHTEAEHDPCRLLKDPRATGDLVYVITAMVLSHSGVIVLYALIKFSLT